MGGSGFLTSFGSGLAPASAVQAWEARASAAQAWVLVPASGPPASAAPASEDRACAARASGRLRLRHGFRFRRLGRRRCRCRRRRSGPGRRRRFRLALRRGGLTRCRRRLGDLRRLGRARRNRHRLGRVGLGHLLRRLGYRSGGRLLLRRPGRRRWGFVYLGSRQFAGIDNFDRDRFLDLDRLLHQRQAQHGDQDRRHMDHRREDDAVAHAVIVPRLWVAATRRPARLW